MYVSFNNAAAFALNSTLYTVLLLFYRKDNKTVFFLFKKYCKHNQISSTNDKVKAYDLRRLHNESYDGFFQSFNALNLRLIFKIRNRTVRI